MKIDGKKYPVSSFLSMEKDASIIIDKMMKDERLKRLLYYNTSDALDKPNVTEDQTYKIIKNNIKVVPKLYIDGSLLSYIIISFNNFTKTSNPEFRDNIVEFDIICHFDQWQLKDFALRPYKIAAEIDTLFNDQKLTGLGKLEFLWANELPLNDEYAGLCLIYKTVHGEEDKKGMPNPKDAKRFVQDFMDSNND